VFAELSEPGLPEKQGMPVDVLSARVNLTNVL